MKFYKSISKAYCKLFFLLIYVSLSVSQVSYALDFGNLVLRASKEDPQILNAISSREATSLRLAHEKKLFNPSSYLTINSVGNTVNLTGIDNIENVGQKFNTNTATISVVQSIYNPLRTFNIQQASLQSEFERVQLDLTINDISTKILQIILDLSGAYYFVKNYELEANAINKLISKQKDNANENENEILNYRIRLAQSEGQATQARNLLRQKENELIRLCGPSNYKEETELILDPLLQFTTELPSLEVLFSKADNESLQLFLQRLILQISRSAVEQTSSDRYPTVDLVANGIVSKGGPSFPNAKTKSATIGLQIFLPLGSGGVGSIMKNEAILQESRAKNDLEAQRKFIQQNISDIYYYYQNTVSQVKTESTISNIYKQRKNQLPSDNSSTDPFYLMTLELEDEMTKLQSLREINRLTRDLVMNKFKLWAISEKLDTEHFQKISKIFKK